MFPKKKYERLVLVWHLRWWQSIGEAALFETGNIFLSRLGSMSLHILCFQQLVLYQQRINQIWRKSSKLAPTSRVNECMGVRSGATWNKSDLFSNEKEITQISSTLFLVYCLILTNFLSSAQEMYCNSFSQGSNFGEKNPAKIYSSCDNYDRREKASSCTWRM